MNDLEALAKLIIQKSLLGYQILELGAEMGGSTVVLAHICKTNGGHLTTIDNWEGRDDIYDAFIERLKGYDVTIIRKNLFDCLFDDKIFDVIYFDAIYSYPECKVMLEKYLPKLKRGGLAIGHGGDFLWTRLSHDIQDKLRGYLKKVKSPEVIIPAIEVIDALNLSDNGNNFLLKDKSPVYLKVHAGLSLALYEVFNDDYEIISKNTLWWKRIK